ncbi:MAG: glucosaminidase domain-containing protein [Puniceicoccales bacterium]|nr:glucosaminidase domain-containing protein [Puniceicoccales bacterium]
MGVVILFSIHSISEAKVSIMGKAVCTREQMERYLLSKNPKASKYASYIPIYLREGEKEGVRGDIAFTQSLVETGFFRFGGDVKPQQNNFSGLGTIGHGQQGYYFKTPLEGIRAQIQHLKAYGSKQPLRQPCVDPRFQNVLKRGCALCVEDLGGLWAYPGYEKKKYKSLKLAKRAHDSYGDHIVNHWHAVQKIKASKKFSFFGISYDRNPHNIR